MEISQRHALLNPVQNTFHLVKCSDLFILSSSVIRWLRLDHIHMFSITTVDRSAASSSFISKQVQKSNNYIMPDHVQRRCYYHCFYHDLSAAISTKASNLQCDPFANSSIYPFIHLCIYPSIILTSSGHWRSSLIDNRAIFICSHNYRRNAVRSSMSLQSDGITMQEDRHRQLDGLENEAA